jgi:nicotinamide-nucleotide amidase
MLPGVPLEMRNLLEHEVVPRLASRSSGSVIRSLLVRTTGIPESSLAERLGHIEPDIAPVSLAYLPGLEGVDLRLSAWEVDTAEADRLLRAAADLVRGRAGEHVYGEGERDLAELVLEAARSAGVRVAVAESCTGGMVGARLTDIPGSSDVFVGGVIAYDNAVKRNALEVPADLLEQHGAVSEPVARAMVEGLVHRFGVSAGLSITGIAGPGGGSEGKPVGTVWIGCLVNGAGPTRRFLFPGTRHEIRARAAQAALHLLLRQLGLVGVS